MCKIIYNNMYNVSCEFINYYNLYKYVNKRDKTCHSILALVSTWQVKKHLASGFHLSCVPPRVCIYIYIYKII